MVAGVDRWAHDKSQEGDSQEEAETELLSMAANIRPVVCT
jgi:hypothetical protein